MKSREQQQILDMDATHAEPEGEEEGILDEFVSRLRQSPRLQELKKKKLLELLAAERLNART